MAKCRQLHAVKHTFGDIMMITAIITTVAIRTNSLTDKGDTAFTKIMAAITASIWASTEFGRQETAKKAYLIPSSSAFKDPRILILTKKPDPFN